MRNLVCAVLLVFSPLGLSAQELLDEVLVHIQCFVDGKPHRAGSGVLISEDGIVLTAAHVVFAEDGDPPANMNCTGTLGNRNLPRNILTFKDRSQSYDAALLKYPGDGHPYLQYCELEKWMRGIQVSATGFPLEVVTELPSSRIGVLSNIEPHDGVIEATVDATSGMSGGPVTLFGQKQLIGIVQGADVELTTGLKRSDRVVPVEMLHREFSQWGLRKNSQGCASDYNSLVSDVRWLRNALGAMPDAIGDGEDAHARLNVIEEHLQHVDGSFRWSAHIEQNGSLEIQYRKIIPGERQATQIQLHVNAIFNEAGPRKKIDYGRIGAFIYPLSEDDRIDRLSLSDDRRRGTFLVDDFKDKLESDILQKPTVRRLEPGIARVSHFEFFVEAFDHNGDLVETPDTIIVPCTLEECFNRR